MFKIDHVIKFRGCGKNKEALIKCKGWPKNSWIPASNIVTYPNKKINAVYLTTTSDTTTHLPFP